MKMKKLLIALIVGTIAFTFVPSVYAATDGIGDDVNINVNQLTDEIIGGEDVDESVILPQSDEEYVIESSVKPVFEQEGIFTRSIRSNTVRFEKVSAKKARFSIAIKASLDVTKLTVKTALYKKEGNTYKNTGKSESFSIKSSKLTGKTSFSVNKDANYKVKVTVTEYKGDKKYVKQPVFYKMSRNGF